MAEADRVTEIVVPVVVGYRVRLSGEWLVIHPEDVEIVVQNETLRIAQGRVKRVSGDA